MRKGPGSVYDKWNISVVIFTQIFHSGQTSHGGNRSIFEVMTLPNFTKGNSYFSSFLVSSMFYQGRHDRSHKLWNIVSSQRYILHKCVCCWNVATYKWKVHNGKIEIISKCNAIDSSNYMNPMVLPLTHVYRNYYFIISTHTFV